MTHHPALSRGPRELVQLAGDGAAACPMEGNGRGKTRWRPRPLHRRHPPHPQGIEIGGVGHILHRLAGIERAYGQPLMFDGEFIAPGGYQATLRHIGRGCARRRVALSTCSTFSMPRNGARTIATAPCMSGRPC